SLERQAIRQNVAAWRAARHESWRRKRVLVITLPQSYLHVTRFCWREDWKDPQACRESDSPLRSKNLTGLANTGRPQKRYVRNPARWSCDALTLLVIGHLPVVDTIQSRQGHLAELFEFDKQEPLRNV